MHWELYSGAKSTIIPGIVPAVNYTAIYDDNRLSTQSTGTSTSTSTSTGTGTGTTVGTPTLAPAALVTGMGPNATSVNPVGPGVGVTLVPPTRTVQATIGGSLGIFPGQWVKLLAPAAIQPQVSISDNETSVGNTKTLYNRVYRFDNRAIWASGGKVDVSCTNCTRSR